MNASDFAPLITAVAGTAGVTALLALVSQLSDLRRAQSLVESIEATLKLVAGDRLAASALTLSLRVAVIHLAAASLIRVPLYRWLALANKLVGLAVVIVIVALVVLVGLPQLLGVDVRASPLSLWALSGSVVVALFLAYRAVLSEQRSAFVAEVLHEDDIDLAVIRKYNKSYIHLNDSTEQLGKGEDPVGPTV